MPLQPAKERISIGTPASTPCLWPATLSPNTAEKMHRGQSPLEECQTSARRFMPFFLAALVWGCAKTALRWAHEANPD